MQKRGIVCNGPVGVGGPSRPVAPPPPPLFELKVKKRKVYNSTVENTELMTQRNSPFDFTKYFLRANF